MTIFNNISQLSAVTNIIATIGTFDGVHLGHQKIINRLLEIKNKQGGETLLFTFDPHPRKILYPLLTDLKLITTTTEKCKLLQKFGIDYVLVYPFNKTFASMHASDYVNDIIAKGLKTKTLVIGYDHRFGANREGNIDSLKSLAQLNNFNVEEIPVQEINDLNISSSRIRKALDDGDIITANTYLGYSFFITGTIIKGKQLGRTLGYPTANIKITDTDKIIPKIGVYAVKADIKGVEYKGMLNIGINPTMDTDDTVKIEVNFFGFNADIYDEEITINFIKRIRDEQKFANLDELKNQLAKDKIVSQHA